MTATLQRPDFIVSHIGYQRLQFDRIEEMLADIGTVFGFVRLIIAVDDFHHALAQYAVHITGEDFVPVAVPQHLDDIPAGATEFTFQLLHDFAVAAYRAVQALQVTVDDEDQIVELFACSETNLPA